jgi:SAM-dependent methyltransferase
MKDEIIKKYTLIFLKNIYYLWALIPGFIRANVILFLLILETRSMNASNGLKKAFHFKDKLDWIINERALALGNGIHPKHRLINYHNFFIDYIVDGESILDVGCGYGAVAQSISQAHPNSIVCGVDINSAKVSMANKLFMRRNLSFKILDILDERNSIGTWNVVVMSNVLEHIENRVEFLKTILKKTHAKKILIRVPLFERSWEVPMRKELNINYYSDQDHKIEHSLLEFYDEMSRSSLVIDDCFTKWGEIWVKCSPFNSVR